MRLFSIIALSILVSLPQQAKAAPVCKINKNFERTLKNSAQNVTRRFADQATQARNELWNDIRSVRDDALREYFRMKDFYTARYEHYKGLLDTYDEKLKTLSNAEKLKNSLKLRRDELVKLSNA